MTPPPPPTPTAAVVSMGTATPETGEMMGVGVREEEEVGEGVPEVEGEAQYEIGHSSLPVGGESVAVAISPPSVHEDLAEEEEKGADTKRGTLEEERQSWYHDNTNTDPSLECSVPSVPAHSYPGVTSETAPVSSVSAHTDGPVFGVGVVPPPPPPPPLPASSLYAAPVVQAPQNAPLVQGIGVRCNLARVLFGDCYEML